MRFDDYGYFWKDEERNKKPKIPIPQHVLDEQYRYLCVYADVLYRRDGNLHIYTFSSETAEEHMRLIPKSCAGQPCTRTVSMDANGVVTIVSDTQIQFR